MHLPLLERAKEQSAAFTFKPKSELHPPLLGGNQSAGSVKCWATFGSSLRLVQK
jgi:hypothetical protein